MPDAAQLKDTPPSPASLAALKTSLAAAEIIGKPSGINDVKTAPFVRKPN
jgi:hypothetical protein